MTTRNREQHQSHLKIQKMLTIRLPAKVDERLGKRDVHQRNVLLLGQVEDLDVGGEAALNRDSDEHRNSELLINHYRNQHKETIEQTHMVFHFARLLDRLLVVPENRYPLPLSLLIRSLPYSSSGLSN